MGNLFDLIDVRDFPVANDVWRPEPPPCLDRFHTVYFNFETTGFAWFAGDLPIALSIYAGDRSYYLPFGHAGGGNLSEETVYRFAQNELKGKHLVNINTRFDIHMGRVWGDKMGNGGLDFETMGCTVSDVSHYAALLDDHRFHMNLDSLIRDYLKETPMARLDESRMRSYSAGAAQARARYNVEAVKRLRDVFWPMLDAEGLQRVRQLEDDVIFVVVEMEKNGTLINVELLDKWLVEVKKKYQQCVMKLFKETGLKINPNSGPDIAKLYRHLKIPIVELTAKGKASFTDEVIKHEKHPVIDTLRHARKYKSLDSKLLKYKTSVDTHGILRYALHQMRASKDDSENSGESGTVVGRFTSTEIIDGVGINIQQVLKPEKQILTFGDEFFVRELHIPASGLHLSVDAEQIQYRLFAHEANNPEVLAGYKENPRMSFHKTTLKMIRVYIADLPYKKGKDVNFAKIFAAGPTKLALMLGFITKKEYLELKAERATRNHPKLAGVKQILDIYAKVLPEGDEQLKKATNLAETRGYIKSILGRRIRFPNGARSHKALNSRIISSEADIVKTKAVEIHRARKYTGFLLRFQVHDEFDGDIPDIESANKVAEILNTQTFPTLRVPILWKPSTGTSWGDSAREELDEIRREMHL